MKTDTVVHRATAMTKQRGARFWRGAMLTLAAVMVVASARPASAQSGDLFNNFNSDGVLTGTLLPPLFATNSAHITEIVTYHWNNGRGATPGTISLRSSFGQIFGPFPARGVSGQGGAPNVNWVAATNVTVPAGYYTVLDSDPYSRSYNARSGNRGFAIVRGSLVNPPAPTPTPTPVSMPPSPPSAPGFRPCFVNSGSVAAVGPCVAAPGASLTVQMSRRLPRPPALLLFRANLARGVPAAVTAPLSGSGSYYSAIVPPAVCAAGTGGMWDIYLYDSGSVLWGDIGRLTVDCRAYGR